MTKRALIRADSSTDIGSGHVMRCLTLAQSLKQHGWQVTFICRQHPGNCHSLILTQGFQFLPLAEANSDGLQGYEKWLGVSQLEDASQCLSLLHNEAIFDLCVVDHYALDQQWQVAMDTMFGKLLVIDDLANRRHHCDLLLDQTFARKPDDYQDLAPSSCRFLMGKQYMLLRQEFAELRSLAMTNRAQPKVISNLLVAMGGNDPDNVCENILSGINYFKRKTGSALKVAVMTTSVAKHVDAVASKVDTYPWLSMMIDCRQVAEFLLSVDLAIGASGSSAWERCCMGLPTLSVINADNQTRIDAALAEQGASLSLGHHQQINDEAIFEALVQVTTDQTRYQDMIQNCFEVCDGLGAERVATLLSGDSYGG